MATSACVGEATATLVVAELLAQFGSLADEHGTLMLAVLEIVVPGVSPKLALTTRGKLTGVFTASDAMLQEMVPVPPTAGILAPQFHPLGTPKETNVEPVGIISVNVAVPEVDGPLLVTTCA